MPCPETEVLLGGSTIHLLFLSSGFFNLETGFCRQMCKSAPTYAIPHHLDSCGWPRTHVLSFHLALVDARIFLHRSASVCLLSGVPRTVWLIASMWVPTPLVEAIPTQILKTCTSELPFPSGGNESYQGVLH